jgi:hypothetical protein
VVDEVVDEVIDEVALTIVIVVVIAGIFEVETREFVADDVVVVATVELMPPAVEAAALAIPVSTNVANWVDFPICWSGKPSSCDSFKRKLLLGSVISGVQVHEPPVAKVVTDEDNSDGSNNSSTGSEAHMEHFPRGDRNRLIGRLD